MNLNRVQNIFVSDGTALPVNNAAITAMTAGQVGIFGADMTALNPAGGDTITTQPSIYLYEKKTTTSGTSYYKKSMRIDGANVISYQAESYTPAKREVWTIGHNRDTGVGTIAVSNSTNYNFSIRFKNDKWLYSCKPEMLNVNFTSAAAATQLTIATQITNAINNSSFGDIVEAITIGDGTGVYGLTAATDYGVEITAKDVNQFSSTTYTPNHVYFSVHVNDASGFSTTTTCTQIQAFTYGVGTFAQVRNLESINYQYEGVLNRRQWPIPELDYSSSSSYVLSAAIGVNVAGTTGEDTVTFSSTVAAILRAGEKVQIDSVNYEIKYFVSTTVAVLTSPLLSTFVASDVCKVRVQYDLINIDFNDAINGPTGVIAVSNKSVMIAVPALDAGDAYSGISAAGQDFLDILNAWMITTPRAFANVSI